MRRIAFALILLPIPMIVVGGCARGTPSADAKEPDLPPPPLPTDYMQPLQGAGWRARVGDGLGIWVSVARQELYGIRSGKIVFEFRCSTAARGVGNQADSYRTPLGWHVIAERYGDGLPAGAVFREREFTGRVWKPGEPAEADTILTRILWLRGLEPGVNAGPGIDTHERYIYIHGTPQEGGIGRPGSFGCVRMTNVDVIELYGQAETGTPVLITEW